MATANLTFAPFPRNSQFKNLSGRTFVRLTVLGYAGDRKWHCRCQCGTVITPTSNNLLTGNTTKCRNCSKTCRTHGHTVGRTVGRRPHKMYWVWAAMIQRCHNPDNVAYRNYGARGITVCDRWRNSFPDFLADVGERPSPKHSLDRIDNDKGYEPGNVRWATRTEQNRNSRNALRITHNGETRCLREWSEHLGISYATLQYRYYRGWPVDKLLKRR